MTTITVEVKNRKALSILEGMEKAGLIAISSSKKNHVNLVQRLRNKIPGSRAEELMKIVDKEREQWEERY
jgi:hypothetical protein